MTRYVRETLWDVEGDDLSTLNIADTTVAPVSPKDVDEFSSRYHYARTGGSALWRWGLWHGATLLGVVAYNNPTRSVQESVFGPEHHEHVWHMGRLAMAHHAPPNSESRLIGGSLRAITRDHPYVWAILTYAAISAGHIGYVYQATNALYTGTGGDAHYFLDGKGNRHSPYLSGHVSVARGESMGWTRYDDLPKHRYVYLLGSKTRRKHLRAMLRYPVLPYPKETVMTTPTLNTLETVSSSADVFIEAIRPTSLVVVVDASPAPQGSKRHVGNGILIESSRSVKPFREAIVRQTTQVIERKGWATTIDPVRISLTFTLPRPAGHYKRVTKNHVASRVLKDDAPAYPAKRPDLDKLTRAVLDALTTCGAYDDDGLVVQMDCEKTYPGGSLDALDEPGVIIVVRNAA